MDARALVAALRAEHYPVGRTEVCCWAHGDYGVPWPCPSAVAADRIEAALGCHTHPADGGLAMRAALDGAK